MSLKTDKLLAKGLAAGFGNGTVRTGITRGSFDIDSSHLETIKEIYHDEWVAIRIGGGQELVKSGNVTYTRVYAGGVIPTKDLEKMGITIAEIMDVLKKQIVENGEKIRLHTDFEPKLDSPWQYSYKVTGTNKDLSMTTGKELIKYKNTIVFEHDFIICPVE